MVSHSHLDHRNEDGIEMIGLVQYINDYFNRNNEFVHELGEVKHCHFLIMVIKSQKENGEKSL